jgi:hypothetical protein
MAKTWMGSPPEQCDFCEHKIMDEFVDGGLIGYTCWAIMCPPCFRRLGRGLGTGLGQRYTLEHGKYVKVEG